MVDRPLDGLVAVVTGATRGLGLETATHLASQGAAVALCSRSLEASLLAASDLAAQHHVATFAAAVDVAVSEEVAHFAAQVAEALGSTDIVVNNAAVLGPVGTISDVAADAWAHALDVNVMGAVHTAMAFSDQLQNSSRGRVINLSGGGVGGPRPMRRTSAYVVSKAAVVALTEAMAHDFEGSSVTVNAIAPGAFPTSFLDGVLAAGARVAGADLLQDAAGRVGKTIEASQLAPFLDLLDYLLSSDGSWLSGRMLSARWETPQRLELLRGGLTPNAFMLRRIDGDLYAEVSS